MPGWLTDALGVATFAACVVAVFLARRGARRKWQAAYASGEAAAAARAAASAGVHVGDVTYVRGSLATGHHGTSARDHDHHEHYDDDFAADVAALALRVASDGDGVGDLRAGASGHGHVRRVVVARPVRDGGARALHPARSKAWDVTGDE